MIIKMKLSIPNIKEELVEETEKSPIEVISTVFPEVKEMFDNEKMESLFWSEEENEDSIKNIPNPPVQPQVVKIQCNYCDVSFNRRQELEKHLKRAHRRKFVCQICPKAYYQYVNLTRHHQEVHLQIKCYQCDFCSTSFARKDRLKYHLHLHTGIKEFACGDCNAKFIRNSSLNRHKKVHQRQKELQKQCRFDLFIYDLHVNVPDALGRIEPKYSIVERLFACLQRHTRVNMLGKLSEVLEAAAEVVAPPPTPLQDFEYHWRQVKQFYGAQKTPPKFHIDHTKIPDHIEEMLKILVREEQAISEARSDNHLSQKTGECLNFVLTTRPLDLLTELAINDQPPGVKVCVLNFFRRLLSCLADPPLEHASLFQPVQRLIVLCDGTVASPYETEEVLFLETVAGLVRKREELINLFLPAHQNTSRVMASLKGVRSSKTPTKNPLFESERVEEKMKRFSLVETAGESSGAEEEKEKEKAEKTVTKEEAEKTTCDCEDGDRFVLLDALMSYFDSADASIIVRACEGTMIVCSQDLSLDCSAIRASLDTLTVTLGHRVARLCERIPEDTEPGEIEDAVVTWGLIPRDEDGEPYVCSSQLSAFLCWMDYCDCLCRECPSLGPGLGQLIRKLLFETIIEPALLGMNAQFTLVLTSKIVKQLKSSILMEEVANWLVGEKSVDEITGADCFLTILIEAAQENVDLLLQTLQLVEALLENPNERILHAMLFFYLTSRAYCDRSASQAIQSWSDEEDNRERRRGSVEAPVKSRTLAPSNILKIVNNFLLLLPRQLMNESLGTSYEDYMHDASRHYKLWVRRTEHFRWPVEAVFPSAASTPEHAAVHTSGDSGISEGSFYEGPLLRLLFSHVTRLTEFPYELNIAVVAILSKLALLPHPYLHEILLVSDIPVAPGATTLWTVLQTLSRQLLAVVPQVDDFLRRIHEVSKRLLENPPMLDESTVDSDPLFEGIIVLEEFCKELAAIAFVKYHYATE